MLIDLGNVDGLSNDAIQALYEIKSEEALRELMDAELEQDYYNEVILPEYYIEDQDAMEARGGPVFRVTSGHYSFSHSEEIPF